MKKKNIIIFSSSLVAVILLAIGTSYALFRYDITGGTNFKLAVGKLQLTISDAVNENRIIVDGLIPTKDEDALEANGYDFTLSNTGNIDSSYKIYLDDILLSGETRARLSNDVIKVNLSEYGTINNSNTIRLSDSDDRMLLTGILKAGRSQKYTLRIWLDHSAGNSEQNKYFASQLRIEGQQYNEVSLRNQLIDAYQVVEATPDFTVADTTNNTGKIFKSTATNSGKPTYYFRGQVNDNYVKFANKMWRIVRINEDKTVRLILEDYITDGEETGKYQFNSTNTLAGMYYSTSDVAKPTVDAWYQDNIASNYDEYVASGEYFCEQARVADNQEKVDASLSHDNLELELIDNYTPDFKCILDSNNKGPITGKVGLLTLDEVLYAGASKTMFDATNGPFYLNYGQAIWLSSPDGYNNSTYVVWRFTGTGGLTRDSITLVGVNLRTYRPVINLKDGVIVTGTGTQADPYTVQPKRNYADTEAILASFNSSNLKQAVVCTNNNGIYEDCATYPTLESAIASRNDSVIILTSDITRTDTINISSTKNIVLDLNGHKITKTNDGATIVQEGSLIINDSKKSGKIANTSTGDGIVNTGTLVMNDVTLETGSGYAALYSGSDTTRTGTVTINGGKIYSQNYSVIIYSSNTNALTIKDATLKSEDTYTVYENDQASECNTLIDGSTIISENASGVVHKSTGTMTIKDSKIYAINSGSSTPTSKYGLYIYGNGTVNITGNTIIENKGTNSTNSAWSNVAINNGYSASGVVNITGTKATFDQYGNYQSGILIRSNASRAIYGLGNVTVNGAYLESTNGLAVEMITGTGSLSISNSTIKAYIDAISNASTGTATLTNNTLTYGNNDGTDSIYGYKSTKANGQADIVGCTFTATGTNSRGITATKKATITIRNSQITSEKNAINITDGATNTQLLSSGNTFNTTNDVSVYLNAVGTYDFYNMTITSFGATIYNSKASAIRIKGGQYNTTGTPPTNGDCIYNVVEGTIQMCDATINSTRKYDMRNAGAGTITYNNVIFTNGTTTPDASRINPGTGSISQSNTCQVPNE